MGFLTHFRRDLAQILFRNPDPHAIPSMDGAFSPNDRLETAEAVGEPIIGADAVLEAKDGALLVSAANKVFRLGGESYGDRTIFAEFDGKVGALALRSDGALYACTEAGLAVVAPNDRPRLALREAGGEPLGCLTAVALGEDGSIFLSNGAREHRAEDWRIDLMENNLSGRLIGCTADFRDAKILARNLAYPAGLAVANNCLWFTESFAHRLSRAPLAGAALASPPRPVIRNLPGYPSRLARTRDGFWMSLFALRTHLVEFVLREDDFREEMMRAIPEPYWVAPALSSGKDCLEPLQVGGLRALGIEKPWAPARSYGLAVRLNSDGEAVESLHSRVGGRRHGVTCAIETACGIVIVSKGLGQLVLVKSGGTQ